MDDTHTSLKRVSNELKLIDKDLIEINKEIKGFCDELGIDTPF